MSVQDLPHYELPATELAAWLDAQGEDVYWITDPNEVVLAERISMPCTGANLANLLRRLNRPLLAIDKDANPKARGQAISRDDLDRLVEPRPEVEGNTFPPDIPYAKERALHLCWKDNGKPWYLLEDLEETAFWREVDAEEGVKE